MQHKRKLLAVLFADIEGYTAMMHADEKLAVTILDRFKSELEKLTVQHQGVIRQFYGDACLVTFENASEAVQCAKELQENFRRTPVVKVRIGIHLGDVMVSIDNIHGDSVNIASRIESMGIPHSVLMSKSIADQIINQTEFQTTSLGKFDFKNIDEPIEVLALSNEGFSVPDRSKIQGKFKTSGNRIFSQTIVKYAIGILFFLVAAALYFYLPETIGKTKHTRQNTFAVFPFRDMSVQKNQGDYCKALMLAVYSNLSKIGSISLLNINEILDSQDDYPTNKELLSQVQVENYVTGNVLVFNNQEDGTVLAELLNAKSPASIWTNNFQINLADDFFSVVNEVASKIVDQMSITVSEEEHADLNRIPTNNTRAYSLFAQGKKLAESRTKIDLERSYDLLAEAIELDDDFAEAYAEIANTLFALGYYSFKDREKSFRESELMAIKAIDIYDKVFTAHSILGTIAELIKKDTAEAGQLYRKAIEINPNDPTALRLYSVFLKRNRNYTRALGFAKKSAELSPFNGINNRNYIDLLLSNGKAEEAKLQLDVISERLPDQKNQFAGYYGDYYAGKGENDRAIRYYEERLESSKSVAGQLGYLYGMKGRIGDARQMLSLLSRESQYFNVNSAMIYMGMAISEPIYSDSMSYHITRAVEEGKGINVICDHPFFNSIELDVCNE